MKKKPPVPYGTSCYATWTNHLNFIYYHVVERRKNQNIGYVQSTHTSTNKGSRGPTMKHRKLHVLPACSCLAAFKNPDPVERTCSVILSILLLMHTFSEEPRINSNTASHNLGNVI